MRIVNFICIFLNILFDLSFFLQGYSFDEVDESDTWNGV